MEKTMIYLVKSDKVKFRFFFQSFPAAMSLVDVLLSKKSELLDDLQLKQIDFSDSKDTQYLANEVYKKMYEE
jgi:hypothetical protein